jgi:enoyl-CoA hydratase
MSSETSVQSSRDRAVTLVTLGRPARRNAVDPAAALALYEAFAAFDDDADARVAVLTGDGGHFCAGFDLEAVADGRGEAWLEGLHFGQAGRPPLGPMGPTRMSLSKPVVAAMAGAAVAGGMELALWCDLRVMDESAWMGVLCRRWGVPLIDGGTVRLPRLVGRGRALDLVLTGRRVEAAECLAIGLCDRVVPDGSALTAALALARALAALPQECLRADRATLRRGDGGDDAGLLVAVFQSGRQRLGAARAHARRFLAGEGRHGRPPAC